MPPRAAAGSPASGRASRSLAASAARSAERRSPPASNSRAASAKEPCLSYSLAASRVRPRDSRKSAWPFQSPASSGGNLQRAAARRAGHRALTPGGVLRASGPLAPLPALGALGALASPAARRPAGAGRRLRATRALGGSKLTGRGTASGGRERRVRALLLAHRRPGQTHAEEHLAVRPGRRQRRRPGRARRRGRLAVAAGRLGRSRWRRTGLCLGARLRRGGHRLGRRRLRRRRALADARRLGHLRRWER